MILSLFKEIGSLRVPYLEEVVVHEGLSHFNNQEDAEDVNNHFYDFVKKF